MISKKKTSKLIFIAILSLMLFSFPFVKMMNKNAFIGHFPLLYFYIFFLWLLVIIIIAVVVERRKKITATDE